MKVSVYLKKCSFTTSNICFRVREKNVDIKVRTIAYHCIEALDCPPNNNKTIVPRFMIAYNSPLG